MEIIHLYSSTFSPPLLQVVTAPVPLGNNTHVGSLITLILTLTLTNTTVASYYTLPPYLLYSTYFQYGVTEKDSSTEPPNLPSAVICLGILKREGVRKSLPLKDLTNFHSLPCYVEISEKYPDPGTRTHNLTIQKCVSRRVQDTSG